MHWAGCVSQHALGGGGCMYARGRGVSQHALSAGGCLSKGGGGLSAGGGVLARGVSAQGGVWPGPPL